MTNRIEIAGYEGLIPNSVYGKDGGKIKTNLGDVDASHLVLLRVFTASTKKAVLDFIQTTAQEIRAAYPGEKPEPDEDDSRVEHVLKHFPEFQRKKIAAGKEKIMKHLEYHLESSRFFQPGNTYLEATNSFVPKALLDDVSDEGISDYQGLINKDGDRAWRLRVRLSGRALPERSEIEALVEKGARDTDIFQADGEYSSYADVRGQLALFDNILTPEKIAEIPNSSEEYVEGRAFSTLVGLMACERAKSIGGLLSNSMQGIIGLGMFGPETFGKGHHGSF